MSELVDNDTGNIYIVGSSAGDAGIELRWLSDSSLLVSRKAGLREYKAESSWGASFLGKVEYAHADGK